MREYLNSILEFIGTETLTDEEFDSITLENTDNQIAVYESLLVILESRESISVTTSRLKYYFLAKGVDVGPLPDGTSRYPASNIFVGASLDET